MEHVLWCFSSTCSTIAAQLDDTCSQILHLTSDPSHFLGKQDPRIGISYICRLKLCSVGKVLRHDGQVNLVGGTSPDSRLLLPFDELELLASIRTSVLCCSLCIPIKFSEFAVKSHSSHLKLLESSSRSVLSGEMDVFDAACSSINRLGGSPFSLTRRSWKERRASRFFFFLPFFLSFFSAWNSFGGKGWSEEGTLA